MNPIDIQIVELARDLLLTTLLIAGPILAVGLVVGVAVSLFQALTSVQEQTMSLIPKMGAVMLVLMRAVSWPGHLVELLAALALGATVYLGLLYWRQRPLMARIWRLVRS